MLREDLTFAKVALEIQGDRGREGETRKEKEEKEQREVMEGEGERRSEEMNQQ